MSSNVIDLPVITRLNLDPDRVLNKAIGELKDVVIIGYDKDDNEYFATSMADGGDIVWLLERMKLRLLRISDDQP